MHTEGRVRIFSSIFLAVLCLSDFSVKGQGVSFVLADNFANRTPLFGPDYWIGGSLSNATSEAGEPLIDGVSSGQTVWGTWTAPSKGILTLSVDTQTFSPLLTVYTGNQLSNLSLVASNLYLACYECADCGCHWRERRHITFHVTGGQAYQIAVDSAIVTDAAWVFEQIPASNALPSGPIVFSFLQEIGYWSFYIPVQTTNVTVGGDVGLDLEFTPAPGNDDFEQRTQLVGSRTHVATSNAGASEQAGEPEHLGNPGGSSVWYSWMAPATGRVTLSTNVVPLYAPPSSSSGGVVISTPPSREPPTCGNEIDQDPPPVFYPVFAAYTGAALNSLTAANCLPMGLEAYPNAVEFDVVKGRTYQIAFDGNRGTTGNIDLYLALTTPAANDRFRNRIRLHGISAAATGFNAGAIPENGGPAIAGSTGKRVWWSWTAPVSGPVSIDLGGSDYSFPTAVFTGTKLSHLSLVATNSGGVSFDAAMGRTYQIAVSDAGGLTGAIRLTLRAPVVEAALAQVWKGMGNMAILRYQASAGQVLLLQESEDGANWNNVRTAVAHQNAVWFLAHPTPRPGGPYYRALIVDINPR